MKGRLFVVLLGFVCLAFVAATIPSYADAPKSSGLVDDLASKLSLKPDQALGAAGSIFSLAKSKLSPTDWGKLAGGFPEMDSLLKAAPAASAVTSALGSQSGVAGLLGQFSSLGISPETAAKIVPEVLSFVNSKKGQEIMNLLSKAIK